MNGRQQYRRADPLELAGYVRCVAVSTTRCVSAAVVMAGRTVPLCREHADEVHRHLSVVLPAARRSEGGLRAAASRGPVVPAAKDRPSIVYYAKTPEGLVKIGYTCNPASRWSSLRLQYGGLSVLVVEPGGFQREVARHAEFGSLRHGQSELFEYRGPLEDHVERLRKEHPDWRAIAQTAHDGFRAASTGGNVKHLRLTIPA